MRDAPERIWADRQRISKWVEGTWTDIEPGDPLYAEYLRVDIAAARVEALQAEVERLREALVEIEGMGFDEPAYSSAPTPEVWIRRRAAEMQRIARAALKEIPDGQ